MGRAAEMWAARADQFSNSFEAEHHTTEVTITTQNGLISPSRTSGETLRQQGKKDEMGEPKSSLATSLLAPNDKYC